MSNELFPETDAITTQNGITTKSMFIDLEIRQVAPPHLTYHIAAVQNENCFKEWWRLLNKNTKSILER